MEFKVGDMVEATCRDCGAVLSGQVARAVEKGEIGSPVVLLQKEHEHAWGYPPRLMATDEMMLLSPQVPLVEVGQVWERWDGGKVVFEAAVQSIHSMFAIMARSDGGRLDMTIENGRPRVTRSYNPTAFWELASKTKVAAGPKAVAKATEVDPYAPIMPEIGSLWTMKRGTSWPGSVVKVEHMRDRKVTFRCLVRRENGNTFFYTGPGMGCDDVERFYGDYEPFVQGRPLEDYDREEPGRGLLA